MRLRPLCVVALLLCESAAWGDGCYIPERAVRKIPEIAAQRAIVCWKDGQETLVIASALDSESQSLGWIIPLPSVPTKIEKASPGILRTLDFCIQPVITHDLSPLVTITIVLACIVNWVVATLIFKPERLGCVVILLGTMGILFSLMLPAMGGSGRATRASSVQVDETVAVGAYLVSILNPTQPEELNAWLAENGFARLPSDADPTVADYISRQWVFAAIKLTRSESGANAPHPIRIDLAAKEAVYPLKLTAIAGGNPRIEVFAIANDRLSCDRLREDFCDKFRKNTNAEPPTYEPGKQHFEWRTTFDAVNAGWYIAHPAISDLMWDGCVLTKLTGTLGSADMGEDLQFAPEAFRSYQPHFFTANGAQQTAVIPFVLAAALWAILSMVRYQARIVQPHGLEWYFWARLLPGIGLSALGAAILFASLPKIETSGVHLTRRPLSLLAQRVSWQIASQLEESPQILEQSEAEIAASLLKEMARFSDGSAAGNDLTGADLRVEDSPGNFTVEKQPERVLVRVYDRHGGPIVRAYPLPDQGNSSHSQTSSDSKR